MDENAFSVAEKLKEQLSDLGADIGYVSGRSTLAYVRFPGDPMDSIKIAMNMDAIMRTGHYPWNVVVGEIDSRYETIEPFFYKHEDGIPRCVYQPHQLNLLVLDVRTNFSHRFTPDKRITIADIAKQVRKPREQPPYIKEWDW